MLIRLNSMWGFAYGIGLVVTSALAAGSGHGTLVPIQVSSAPFGALGLTAAIAATLILWTAVGIGCEWPEIRGSRCAIRAVLVAHYCSVVAVLWSMGSDFVDLVQGPIALWFVFGVWCLLYVYGQAVVWRTVR